MKKKERDALRTLESKELVQKVNEAHVAMTKIHIEKATSQTKNTRQIRKLKHIVAIAQTILREKELAHE